MTQEPPQPVDPNAASPGANPPAAPGQTPGVGPGAAYPPPAAPPYGGPAAKSTTGFDFSQFQPTDWAFLGAAGVGALFVLLSYFLDFFSVEVMGMSDGGNIWDVRGIWGTLYLLTTLALAAGAVSLVFGPMALRPRAFLTGLGGGAAAILILIIALIDGLGQAGDLGDQYGVDVSVSPAIAFFLGLLGVIGLGLFVFKQGRGYAPAGRFGGKASGNQGPVAPGTYGDQGGQPPVPPGQ